MNLCINRHRFGRSRMRDPFSRANPCYAPDRSAKHTAHDGDNPSDAFPIGLTKEASTHWIERFVRFDDGET